MSGSDGFASSVNELCVKAHLIARESGFWEESRETGTMIALIHSELSEMLEVFRKDPSSMSEKIPGFLKTEEEAADVFIRLADMCAGLGMDLGGAIEAKMAFNSTRDYRHGKQF